MRISDWSSDVCSSDLTGFPVNPPQTKEAYWYRSLFEEAFPGEACARTVPGGRSIAFSSPVAIEWDPAYAAAADPSGRAVAGVHNAPQVGATPPTRFSPQAAAVGRSLDLRGHGEGLPGLAGEERRRRS